MSKPFVPKAGTTAECAAFTGLENEVVLDEEKGSLIVHDGVTVGGAHEILPKGQNDELYMPLPIPYLSDVSLNTLTETGVYGVHIYDDNNGSSTAATVAVEKYAFPADLGVNVIIDVRRVAQGQADQQGNQNVIIHQIARRIGTMGSNDHNIMARSGRIYPESPSSVEWGEWFYLVTSRDIKSYSSGGGHVNALLIGQPLVDGGATPSASHYASVYFTTSEMNGAVAGRVAAVESGMYDNGSRALINRVYGLNGTQHQLSLSIEGDGSFRSQIDGAEVATEYMVGDTVKISASQYAGCLTGAAKSLRATIHLGRPVNSAVTKFVPQGTINVRIPSGGYIYNTIDISTLPCKWYVDQTCINFRLDVDTALATNNISLTVDLNITATFE